MRYVKSTIAGIVALLLTTVVLFLILLLVERAEGRASVAIVPGWHSLHFWLTIIFTVDAIFGAGFVWKFRKLAKKIPQTPC
jgi:hypothetical protein